MCDDIEQALAALTARGVTISHPVYEDRWGRLTSIQILSGAELSIYQPCYVTAYDLKS
jgi:hypothetical protein